MTYPGYKQILVSIDTYKKLKKISKKENKSMNRVLKGLIDPLNPTAVGSNPSQPVTVLRELFLIKPILIN